MRTASGTMEGADPVARHAVMVPFISAGLASYLIGAIPFGYLLVRLLKGTDLRQTGSGNIGATNAARVLGFRWFFPIFTLDFLKGFAPVLWLAPWVWRMGSDGADKDLLRVVCGAAALVGHVWPVYLSFRGGKGVATAAGVLAALRWEVAVAGVAVWMLLFLATRIVSVASMIAAVSVSIAQILYPAESGLPITVFCIIMGVLVVILHRANIRRLIRGEEPRVRFSKKT